MKPVAWMIIDVDNGKSLQFKENKFSEINVPLYTAPRELSDDEIDDIWAGISTGDDCIDMHEFAKAILKKASEK
jgi:hypothetical protein